MSVSLSLGKMFDNTSDSHRSDRRPRVNERSLQPVGFSALRSSPLTPLGVGVPHDDRVTWGPFRLRRGLPVAVGQEVGCVPMSRGEYTVWDDASVSSLSKPQTPRPRVQEYHSESLIC